MTQPNRSTIGKTKKSQPRHGKIFVPTSHLTTLVKRFLTTLENIKCWNQLDKLIGEDRLKHNVSNIIEYTFFLQKLVTEQEVETLTQTLEERVNSD